MENTISTFKEEGFLAETVEESTKQLRLYDKPWVDLYRNFNREAMKLLMESESVKMKDARDVYVLPICLFAARTRDRYRR